MILPLKGIKVLDLTKLLPGPFAAQILADFGAEVIKIEDPEGGDLLRSMPPYFNGESVYFHSINRGKKSLTVNLKSAAGQEVFKKLAAQADVVLESLRPGAMEKLGLGYKTLQEINPGLIYCSLSGYGNSGPYRTRAGHDLNYISYAGIADLTGNPGEKPVIPGFQVADIGGGTLWALLGIMLALQAREKNGVGQFCDIAMLDGIFAWAFFFLAGYELAGDIYQRGSTVLNGGYACYNIYSTRDNKYVSLGAIEAKFWALFCQRMGKTEYIEKQYLPAAQSEMIQALEEIFMTKSREEWVEYFADLDICFSPVLDFTEAMQNEQVKQREMLAQVEVGGREVRVIRNPIKMSATPAQVCDVVTALGSHTEEILKSIGYTAEQVSSLREDKVI